MLEQRASVDAHIEQGFAQAERGELIDGDAAIARSSSDAPEIDGVVRILDGKGLKIGDWAQVRVTKSGPYDHEGRIAK